jgi:Domain of unknown function (DUF4430)
MEQLVRRRWALSPVLMVLALAAGLLAGCEERSEDAPAAGAPAATLVATTQHGARELLATRVAPGRSVMRALRGATDVRTAYAGGFVEGMLGLTSDPDGPADWFFSVNGIGSSVGAKDVRLSAGDAVWWDYRDWGGLVTTPAVVGAWPAPLVVPSDARRPVIAAAPLAGALTAAGATLTGGASPWRARVGASDALEARDPAWRRALADPDAAGLTATVEDGRILALAPDGSRRVPVPGARALIAAVPTATDPGGGVLVAVAGLDEASARAAARAVAADPRMLAQRYALTFDGAGNPVRAAGRTGP